MTSIAQLLINKWTDNTTPISVKEDYVKKLANGIWFVEFVKVDGTTSTMQATLDPAITPPVASLKEGKTPRPEQDHLIHAYSVDRAGWRSFVIANIKKFYQL